MEDLEWLHVRIKSNNREIVDLSLLGDVGPVQIMFLAYTSVQSNLGGELGVNRNRFFVSLLVQAIN